MATVFQKNRFKLLTNGVIVCDQFNTNCAEDLATTETSPLPPTVAQLPTATVAPLPVTVAQMPVTVAQMPVTIDQLPATIAQMPTTIAQMPTTIAHMPTTIAHMPTTIAQLPTTIAQLPTTIAQLPTTIAQLPTTIAQLPTTIAQLPTTIARLPATVAQLPTTVAQLPVTISQLPVTIAQLPATVAQAPTTVAQVPTTVAQPPLVPATLDHAGYTAVAAPDVAATTGALVPKSEPRSQSPAPADQQADGEIDIVINNVVCSFSLGCHLNLRQIALNGHNVEYRRESGMVTMKLRKPQITASVWSSGKITCTGATSEEEARSGARRIARVIQKLGFDAKFRKMRIVNVLGCCSMPFEIKINAFSQRFREADYEPELHPGVTYKVADLKATLKIFSTGSITVTAPSVPNVQLAIEHIYPLVAEFRKELSASAEEMRSRKRLLAQQRLEHQHQLHQRYATGHQQPRSGDSGVCAAKRKRLNSDNSCCSSNDDEDKEVESIMC